jgi:hypothetical protein
VVFGSGEDAARLALVGDQLVIAFGPGAWADPQLLLGPAETLGETEAFESAAESAGDDRRIVALLAFEPFRSYLTADPTVAQSFEEWREYLEPLSYLALTLGIAEGSAPVAIEVGVP